MDLTRFRPHVPTKEEAEAAIPEHLKDGAKKIADSARSGNTARAYFADWKKFQAFCGEHSLPAMPTNETTLISFLTHLVDKNQKRATILRCISAISVAHKRQGVDIYTPRIAEFLKGVRRSTRGSAGKRALVVEDIRRMVGIIPQAGSNIAYRDKALILFMFSSAMRRGEVGALTIDSVVRGTVGYSVFISKSKTDQVGAGYWMPIEPGRNPMTCPVRALDAWLVVRTAIQCPSPYLFVGVNQRGSTKGKPLDEKDIGRIVKKWARAAGLNDADIGAHSLRSGHATTALAGGAELENVRNNLRHANISTTEIYDQRTVRPRKITSETLGL